MAGAASRLLKILNSKSRYCDDAIAKGAIGFPAPLGLILPTMRAVAVKRRPAETIDVTIAGLRTLPTLLSDLIETAKREQTANHLRNKPQGSVPRGRGGARRKGLTAFAELIYDLFTIYAKIRKRYPDSGPRPGYSPNGPMVRFVRACVKVVDANIERRLTDKSIQGHFERWDRLPAGRKLHISN
jgi:hypothetical protein